MAKAKKSESVSAAETRKKPAKVKSNTVQQASLVDTNLAAEAAAKRVVAGLAPIGTSAAALPESTSFKNFKDSLNKPASSGLSGILDRTAAPGQKKPNPSFHGGKQTGRNQTFGADVNRSGVPRRTGGG